MRTPEKTAVRLLIVEDVATEAEIAVRQLKRAGLSCTWQRVETESEFCRALREFKPDLILSDFSLPQFDGLSALARTGADAPDIPFIFLSGTIGEERAIQALKNGAIDYVLKSNPERLVPAVTRALDDATARRARRAAEERVSRLTRITQMLSAVNAAVVRIRSRADLFTEACRIAHRVGGYSRAIIVLLEPGSRAGRPVAWAGLEDEQVKGLVIDVADTQAADTSVTGRAIRTADVYVCHDLSELQTTGEDGERLASEGMRSLASLPLLIDGTPVGALTIGSTEESSLDGEELLMLQEITANLSFALQYLQKHDAVEFLSYFDALTGLAKRSLFCERLARMLEKRLDPQSILTVIALDVQRLCVINDSFGRHVGDRLLECVADRLKRHFDNSDQLANLGGGTFAAVVIQAGPSAHALRLLNEQLVALFGEPVTVNGLDIRITIKVGLAEFPESGEDAASLLQNAEAALRKARESGERYLHHRVEMNSEIAERLALEQRLSIALAKQQFLLYYQPEIAIASARVIGLEALLRWRDPEHGIVSPAVFLPILEATGMIVAVGEWVVNQAADDCKRLHRSGIAPLRVAVNVSPQQLRRDHFASQFLAIASNTSGTGYGLDIEIIEGALLDDSTSVIGQLQTLRDAGVRVAIDDFGTGYSSLSRLSQLPIDVLKIDRSFTSRLGMDETSGTVVSTMIQLAKAFGMTTCAEGVETKQQLEILKTLGCHQAQGYLFSRPVPIDEVERFVRASSGRNSLPLSSVARNLAQGKESQNLSTLKTILLIQNDAGEADAIRHALSGTARSHFQVEWVRSCCGALERLACSAQSGPPVRVAAVLVDLLLPDSRGIDSFDQLFRAAPHIPILVLSCQQDEAIAKLAVQRGAQDYILKERIDGYVLPKALDSMIERASIAEVLFEEGEHAQFTLNSIGDAVMCTNVLGQVTYLNAVAEGLTGWTHEQAAGHAHSEVFSIVDGATRETARNPVQSAIQENRVVAHTPNCVLVRRDGTETGIEDSTAPIRDRQGQVTGAVMVFHDVSASRATTFRMSHLAQHDSLTDLPNRVLMHDRLIEAIALSHRHGRKLSLLFVDLDHFKHINDSMGHIVGDRLLQSVGRRLLTCVRSSDTISREGGDEFVVLLWEVRQAHDAVVAAEKILRALREPHCIGQHTLHITGSIGIVTYPDDGTDSETLLKNADAAMYLAKEKGRDNYQFFLPDMALDGN